jgi:hypothetical protein
MESTTTACGGLDGLLNFRDSGMLCEQLHFETGEAGWHREGGRGCASRSGRIGVVVVGGGGWCGGCC